MTSKQTGAEDIRWRLDDLYTEVEHLRSDLSMADADAQKFQDAYRARVAHVDASHLCTALRQLESIQDRAGRAYTFAYLHWVTDTADAARGALLQEVKEAYTQISKKLIFFEVEWVQLPDERAAALIDNPALAGFRHFLEVQRLLKDHVLTEPEEKILAEADVTGRSAWNRFFDELLSAERFDLEGESVTEQEVLSKLHDPGRSVRRAAAFSFSDGLRRRRRELTFIFNTILTDKASQDRLRRYPTWVSARHLSNEVDPETVSALINAVTARYDLVERYYNLKRRLLGVDEMMDYDRYAPIDESDTTYSWDKAKLVVLDAYAAFHDRAGRVATRFFDGQWIDAAVVPGKRGGAFSHGAVPSVHPYILMNYTGKIRDVQTLAHELGHGIHQYLARKQGVLQADTPLTTAETASVFGEMLVFRRLLATESEPRNRLAMLVGKIDDTIATVFRQVAMNRFEDRIHTLRREKGELASEQFDALWMETQQAMYRGSVTLGDHYRSWWSYIPHFLHTPGYVYAYAFGELLVLALHARYEAEGDAFADRYLQLLEAGGSDWPHVLVRQFGIDLKDLTFWATGLSAIENQIAAAEALSTDLI